MTAEIISTKFDRVDHAAIPRTKLHFQPHYEIWKWNTMNACECGRIDGWAYLRRLPNIDWFNDDGGGMQLASLMSASSRLFAAIVENLARVSGVILFMVENARAACSSAGFLWTHSKWQKKNHFVIRLFRQCPWLLVTNDWIAMYLHHFRPIDSLLLLTVW